MCTPQPSCVLRFSFRTWVPVDVSCQGPGRRSHTATEPQASVRAGQAGPSEAAAFRALGGPRLLPFACFPSGTLRRLGSRGKPSVAIYPRELVCHKQECQLLRILVENQGRVNFSWKIQNQRKGGLCPPCLVTWTQRFEGGVGGKTEPRQRRTPGCGDQRCLSPPSVLSTPTAGRGRPGCLQGDPAPLGNSRGSSGLGWEAFLVVWRPSVMQVRPVHAPPG